MSDERARLFVALELPAAAREALAGWAARLGRRHPELRLVAPGSLHVTLCFLGSRPVAEIERAGELCAAAAGTGAVVLELAGAICLPARRPRVIAAELTDHEARLAKLQAGLADAFVAAGLLEAERRRFRPHVTVARVRGASAPGRGRRAGRSAQRARAQPVPRADPEPIRVADLPAPPGLALTGDTVTLMRSWLGAGGARYEAMRTVRLDPP